MSGIALGTARGTGPAAALFASFAGLPKERFLPPDMLRYGEADAANFARTSGISALLGGYAWQRTVAGFERRDFRPLVYPTRGGYAMPVSLLTGRVEGRGRAASRAEDFLLWLLGPENQKKLSMGTGLMAANFAAANLDPNASAAREVALRAAEIVPIDPEPAKGSASEAWEALLARILDKPMEWKRVLAESGNGPQ